MKDPWCFSYKMRKGQFFLSQAKKDKRKNDTVKLFNKFKRPLQPNMLWFFSDNKNFCHNQKVNIQNKRLLPLCPQDVALMMKSKHPVHTRVVPSNGDIRPPLIFPQGLRFNMEAYIKCLEEIVLS